VLGGHRHARLRGRSVKIIVDKWEIICYNNKCQEGNGNGLTVEPKGFRNPSLTSEKIFERNFKNLLTNTTKCDII
jgi:hypothetical protein